MRWQSYYNTRDEFCEQELFGFIVWKNCDCASVKDNKTNLTTTKFLQLNSYVNNEDDNSSYHLHNNRVSQPNLITGSFSSHGYCYNITNVKTNENLVEEKKNKLKWHQQDSVQTEQTFETKFECKNKTEISDTFSKKRKSTLLICFFEILWQ